MKNNQFPNGLARAVGVSYRYSSTDTDRSGGSNTADYRTANPGRRASARSSCTGSSRTRCSSATRSQTGCGSGGTDSGRDIGATCPFGTLNRAYVDYLGGTSNCLGRRINGTANFGALTDELTKINGFYRRAKFENLIARLVDQYRRTGLIHDATRIAECGC